MFHSQGETMKLSRLVCFAAALALTGSVQAADQVKVELKGTHLCCPACVKAVGDTLKKVEGVTPKCDTKTGTVSITAKDEDAAKKALEALAAAGFHGDTGNKDLAIKDDSGAEKGKVEKLTLTGVHNCCGQCNTKLKAAIKKVDGVKADTAKAKSDTFEVTGDFDAAELVKALNAAGFHVKVKK
jgi:copper chaperone CopZ